MFKQVCAVIALCVAATTVGAQGQGAEESGKLKFTQALITTTGKKLDKAIVKSGEYKMPEGKVLFDKQLDGSSFTGIELAAKDGWGQNVFVLYVRIKDDVYHRLTVASPGPDGKFDTPDDVVFNASTGHAQAAIEGAKKVAERGKEVFQKGLKYLQKK